MVSLCWFNRTHRSTTVLRTIVSKLWFSTCFLKVYVNYKANSLLFYTSTSLLKPHCVTFNPINRIQYIQGYVQSLNITLTCNFPGSGTSAAHLHGQNADSDANINNLTYKSGKNQKANSFH